MARTKSSPKSNARPRRRSVDASLPDVCFEAILRVLRGEELDTVSRDIGVTAATLAAWRDSVLGAGEAVLKTRPADERDDEIEQLHARILEVTRSTVYLTRRRTSMARTPRTPRKRGPKTRWTDEQLLAKGRQTLDESAFVGEGHREVRARLCQRGVRTSKRVRRRQRRADERDVRARHLAYRRSRRPARRRVTLAPDYSFRRRLPPT